VTEAQMAFSSISELGALLRKHSVSSVELTQMYLRRLERIGKRLNAVVTLMPDRALAEAKRADADLAAGTDHGPLHGIPYGVKDLLAAKGAPTTWGAAPYRDQVFKQDATVIKLLGAAGAVLIAKLAMIELAGGLGYNSANASFTGPCKNPWNTNYWTGGSSSGPGAAMGAGLVAFAIGSETSGSIVNPSTYCGITGLRPTYGRVSRHGAMALCWTLDKIGPMCRTAEDTGLVLAAIAGRDPNDPTSSSREVPLYSLKPGAPGSVRVRDVLDLVKPSRLRLGLVKDSTKKAQPEVVKNFDKALGVLRKFADIEEVAVPAHRYGASIVTILAAEGAAAFRDIIQDGRAATLADPDDRRGGYSYLTVPAVDYVDAMRERAPIKRGFSKLFKRFDALVAPTFGSVALPIGVSFDKAYPGIEGGSPIASANLAGIPAIAVPNGFGQQGLPTGLSFIGPAFSEADLIALGDEFQSRTDWHRRHPPLAL